MTRSNEPHPEPLALDAKAAAKLLGVSRRTVQRWAAAGQIPHKKMGKLLLFSPRTLKDWMDSSPLCQS